MLLLGLYVEYIHQLHLIQYLLVSIAVSNILPIKYYNQLECITIEEDFGYWTAIFMKQKLRKLE